MSSSVKYNRIMLKLSGEALMGDDSYGINHETINRIAEEISQVRKLGVEVSVVVGAGNIFRGMAGAAAGMDRASADYMGMLATVMNALALQNTLEQIGIYTRVQSAIPMSTVCEPYIRRKAIHHMEKGRVVIFGGGTGNPFFTTDTAAALRAAEMNCDVLFKGTQVDGVYTADPKSDPTAERYSQLSHMEVLQKDLRIMDASAVSVCRENDIPIVVFSIHEKGSFAKVVQGLGCCTIIGKDEAA